MKPYAQLPFQWSAHVLEEPQGKYQHFEFLHKGDGDLRAEVAKSLVDLLPDSGSVIAYNATFEGRVLKALGLKSLASRLVDPLPVIRNHVYDPSFNGSFSIKAVAPALLGESASYKGLLVGDGGEAQSAYLEMIHLQTSPARRAALRLGLLEYCKKDTFEMARLVGWLKVQGGQ